MKIVQIKLFESNDIGTLETLVNDFSKKQMEDIEIVDIKYSSLFINQNYIKSFSAMIIYKKFVKPNMEGE